MKRYVFYSKSAKWADNICYRYLNDFPGLFENSEVFNVACINRENSVEIIPPTMDPAEALQAAQAAEAAGLPPEGVPLLLAAMPPKSLPEGPLMGGLMFVTVERGTKREAMRHFRHWYFEEYDRPEPPIRIKRKHGTFTEFAQKNLFKSPAMESQFLSILAHVESDDYRVEGKWFHNLARDLSEEIRDARRKIKDAATRKVYDAKKRQNFCFQFMNDKARKYLALADRRSSSLYSLITTLLDEECAKEGLYDEDFK